MEQVNQYRHQHTKTINKLTHFIGIPAIILGIMIPLNWLKIFITPQWQVGFSWIVIVTALSYYFLLNQRLAMVMAFIFFLMNIVAIQIASSAPNQSNVFYFCLLFLGGWAFQFIGHFFEKSKPAFFKSLSQLLVGPLFLLIELIYWFKFEKFFKLPYN